MRSIQINQGLLKSMIEQFLESIGEIKHNDKVVIKLPWKEELIPVELTIYKDQEVKVIRHNGIRTT